MAAMLLGWGDLGPPQKTKMPVSNLGARQLLRDVQARFEQTAPFSLSLCVKPTIEHILQTRRTLSTREEVPERRRSSVGPAPRPLIRAAPLTRGSFGGPLGGVNNGMSFSDEEWKHSRIEWSLNSRRPAGVRPGPLFSSKAAGGVWGGWQVGGIPAQDKPPLFQLLDRMQK